TQLLWLHLQMSHLPCWYIKSYIYHILKMWITLGCPCQPSCFSYDISLKYCLRIADDCFPASNFASPFSFPQGGELGKLQIDISKLMARKPIWS
ncbi:hypothetical protein ACJX0J_041882, partial [Zea mays]